MTFLRKTSSAFCQQKCRGVHNRTVPTTEPLTLCNNTLIHYLALFSQKFCIMLLGRGLAVGLVKNKNIYLYLYLFLSMYSVCCFFTYPNIHCFPDLWSCLNYFIISIYFHLFPFTIIFPNLIINYIDGRAEESRISAKRLKTTYFNDALKNHVFQRSVQKPHISTKRWKTTYFTGHFFSWNFVVAALHHLKINNMAYVWNKSK